MWPSLWGEWGEAKWRRVKSRMSVLHAQFRPGCNWWARVLQLCCCSEAIISAFLSAWERLSEAWEEKVWRAVVRDSAQCEMAAEVMGFHAWQTGHSCFLLNPDLELSDESKCSLPHHNYGHERREKNQNKRIHLVISCKKNTPFSPSTCCFLFHPNASQLCSTLLCFAVSKLIQWTKMRWDTFIPAGQDKTSPEENHWLKLKQKKEKEKPSCIKVAFSCSGKWLVIR